MYISLQMSLSYKQATLLLLEYHVASNFQLLNFKIITLSFLNHKIYHSTPR